MENSNDILFATVNLPLLDKAEAVEKILEVSDHFWFWDPYRSTNMLPLMTKGALSGVSGSQNDRDGDFYWLPYTPLIIKDWFDNHVFPWMGQSTRVMALLTKPNFKNKEHIDCNVDEIGSLQHKFRIVLKGNTDTLYFKTESGNVSPPNTNLPFIMDGGWPHGMYNYTDDIKITIAAGASWRGNNFYNNISVDLKKSNFKFPTDISKYLKS